jgi:hypothetical protein
METYYMLGCEGTLDRFGMEWLTMPYASDSRTVNNSSATFFRAQGAIPFNCGLVQEDVAMLQQDEAKRELYAACIEESVLPLCYASSKIIEKKMHL